MSFGGSIKLTGESEYQRALKQINQNLRELSSEMKLATSSYDKNDKSLQALTSQQEVLNKKLTEQSDKVKVLTARYNEVNAQYGKNSTAQKELNKELEDAKNELAGIEKELGTSSKEYKNQALVVKDLENKQDSYNKAVSDAKIKLSDAQAEYNKTSVAADKLSKEIEQAKKPTEDLNEELEESSKQARNAGDGFTVFKGVVADLASKAIQSAISGLKKLGTAVVNVGKEAIESYAEYEQLVGGVETLFKDSAGIVQNYANNAYKTAGISANQYMEQVTSFSASLLQSLGKDTKKAAEYGDLAITDMADNANKMGTSMEMIQNAYQGFAKQNYTMLDNLKLGYGGTKKEMERLIADANKVKKANGEMANLSIESFADMVEAIHIIQTEMGITGTTALEAEKTIQGSTGSMKAAWQNLLTGIADSNQDLGKLVDNFVDSVIATSKNLVPRIKTVVDGIKKLAMSIVRDVFPKLKKEIPQLKPLIETFEWFIKNKDLVIGAMKAIIAAFAVNKIMQFTKSMTDGAKGLLEWVKNATAATVATNTNTAAVAANATAQTGATAATGLLTTATKLLNAAFKANPIGVVVAAVTALVAAYELLINRSDEQLDKLKEETDAVKAQSDAVQEVKDSWDELNKAKQDQINQGMSEINYYESLYGQLKGIADENGKVKEGYESRAKFIVDTLNDALGLEIQLNDGVISGYKELNDTFDKTIEKKKAMLILEAQEASYKDALMNKANALREQAKLESEIAQDQIERRKLLNELEEAFSLADQTRIRKQLEELNTQTKERQNQLQIQQELVKEYNYNITQYETNAALAHEERYSEMTNVDYKYVQDLKNTGDAKLDELNRQLEDEARNLQSLLQLKEESNSDIYDKQIEQSEKIIAAKEKELQDYTNATKEGVENASKEWKTGLENQLSYIYGKKFEFKTTANGMIQMYKDGIKAGEPMAEETMRNFAKKMNEQLDPMLEYGEEGGENVIKGAKQGISNRDLQNSVFKSISSFGSNLLSKLKNSLQEKSPSKATKEMGQYLLEGLGIGIDKEEDSVYKQVSSFGKNVLSTLNGSLSQGVGFPSISTGNLKASSISRTTAAAESTNLVNSFKQALEEMKIELDDENIGKFVDKKVTKLIYT